MPVLMSTPSPTRVMSSSMCSPAERLRLRPWLEKMIEEQVIPGLEWLDEQSRIVKIPWKHAARHGWTRDKDASLFKEWAIHTKKYDPVTDEPKANPKIWKANFRCAINSLPDIEELKDQGKTKGNDAFKVYRLNPKKPKKSKTVTDTTVVRRPKTHRNSKPRTKVQNRQIPPETSSRLSITCDSVIGAACSQPPPPAYDTVIRERTEHRFPLPCRPIETIVRPHPSHSLPGHSHSLPSQSHSHSLPNHTECCPLPPTSFDLPPYPAGHHHVTSRISPVPTPSTPCSTASSPMSTPSQVSSPVFTYPTTALFSMHGRIPAPLNIKQEPNSPYNDDVTSESSGSMTDEEIVDMVDQMREESPLNSPSATSPAPTFENSFNMVSSSNNEWMTSTLDNKQFLSNVVTSKVENVTTSSFQSSMNYTPTSVSASYCAFPVPPTSIKNEPRPDRAPCLGGESQNCFEGNMNGFAI